MTAMALKPMTVKLDSEIRTRMEGLAKSRRRTAHWLMREAIAQYVEREEQKERLRQEAVQAWEAYQVDSLHLTQAEAEEWLLRLENGSEVEHPPCHT